MGKKLLFAFAVLGLCASCSSVDLEPTNQYDISLAFKNRENAELYLNHLYQVDRIFSPFGSCALGGANTNMSDGLTETLKYGGIVAGVGDCNLIMTVDGYQSVQQNHFDCWTTGYQWIRRINEYISAIDTYGKFSKAEGARLKSEAIFLRAEVEFHMMRSHANEREDLGIILYESIDEMTPEHSNSKRAGAKACWDAIEKDLDWAFGFLPEPSEARGRIHKYAAAALEARAMLYAGRYKKAMECAEKVVDSGLYGYLADYDAIFRTVDNKEVVWGSAYTSGVQAHNFDSRYSLPGDYCISGGKGGGYAGPTQEFVDMFDNADGTPFVAKDNESRYITPENVAQRDPRLAKCVLYNGALWKGRAIECREGGVDQKYMPYGTQNAPGNTVTGYYMRKLLDESNKDYDVNGSYQPWCSFRYAEIVLILAECYARGDDFANARRLVSELRNARFGTQVYTQDISEMESALDLILHERAIELCFEGHRFWDLRRTGRAKAELDGKSYTGVLWKDVEGKMVPTPVSCTMGKANSYPDWFESFPIPQNEISNNTLIIQNPGWAGVSGSAQGEQTHGAVLKGLKAYVYYDSTNPALYKTLDLMSGMHVSGETESYSFTFPSDAGLYNRETLSKCRLEASFSPSAVLEMTDSDGNGLGKGLGGWQNLYNKTIHFKITDADGSSISYEFSCRCR